MKTRFALFRTAAIIALTIPALAACGSSALTRFYTLSPATLQQPQEALSPGASRTIVGVGAVEIPDYIDRPQIVTRTSRHQLVLAECDLWAGSLKTDINRVLMQNLAASLPADRYSLVSLKRGIAYDSKVIIHIIRLDAGPEEGAVLEAHWVIVDRDGKANGQVRTTRLSERLEGSAIPDAVDAMSRLVGRLSGEIAAGIRAD